MDDPHHATYPALLSVMLTALILDDASSFEWATNHMNAALNTIGTDGLSQAYGASSLHLQASGVLTYVPHLRCPVPRRASIIPVRVLELCTGMPSPQRCWSISTLRRVPRASCP